jgi:hypothetical protein
VPTSASSAWSRGVDDRNAIGWRGWCVFVWGWGWGGVGALVAWWESRSIRELVGRDRD